MTMQCDCCDKKVQFGNQKVESGKPKYLGGNGRKTRGITRRKFKPNLQRIRVQEGSEVAVRRVCVQCIRSGRIRKAVVRAPFTLPPSN